MVAFCLTARFPMPRPRQPTRQFILLNRSGYLIFIGCDIVKFQATAAQKEHRQQRQNRTQAEKIFISFLKNSSLTYLPNSTPLPLIQKSSDDCGANEPAHQYDRRIHPDNKSDLQPGCPGAYHHIQG